MLDPVMAGDPVALFWYGMACMAIGAAIIMFLMMRLWWLVLLGAIGYFIFF